MIQRTRTDQPVRIAMVAPCAFPSARGSQVLIRELAQALADRGHEVHLVTYPYGENLVPIRGMFLHRASAPKFAGALPTRLGWRKLVLDAYLTLALYRVVRRHRIHVIHAHNYEGPLISYLVRWLTGVPVVYHSHNALSDELARYFKPGWSQVVAHRIGRLLDRHVPRRADYSIALTPELEGFLRAQGVPAGCIATIPPTTMAAAPAEVSPMGTDPFAGRFVVMYAGNLDPYQDLGVLCRGFAAFQREASGALLVLVTHEANWSERLDAQSKGLVQAGQAQVVVAPAFSVVRRLLVRADVLVCPRSSWSGFPIKLLNYLAAARPVVVAEGSAKAIVDGECGLVFRNGDAEHLAAILGRLFRDPALRRTLEDGARLAAAASGTWKQAVAKVERVYASLRDGSAPERTSRNNLALATSRGLIAFSRDRISAASANRAG